MPPEVEYRRADLAGGDLAGDDPEAVAALLDGVTHVFHLAGASSSFADQAEMHRSNVVATQRLLDAVDDRAGRRLERFLYMSSTSVYGEEVQLPSPVPEDVERHPSRGYGKAKEETERVVEEHGRNGLPVVTVRPVSVYGPGNIKLLASAILDVAIDKRAGHDEVTVAAEPIEQRLVHVDDLVAACIHLAVPPRRRRPRLQRRPPGVPDQPRGGDDDRRPSWASPSSSATIPTPAAPTSPGPRPTRRWWPTGW